MQTIKQRAISYAECVIKSSSDWEEVAQALMEHREFGSWLEKEWGDDYATGATNIVRTAEERLGDKLPSSYSN